MAEATSTEIVEDTVEVPGFKEKVDNLECAVCLQPCIHPAQLPCGHIFCFLCIKGIANQSKKCAMCRQEIPIDFIDHPTLLNTESPVESAENFDGSYQWFYEGRNGWWMYDNRTSGDIEEAFQMNLQQFEILICGELYVIDLENNMQFLKMRPWKKRNIKRDLVGRTKCWWQYDERTSRELESCYKSGERICELLIAGFLYVADMDSMLQIRRNDPSRRRRIKRDLATIPKKGVAGLRTEPEYSSSTDSEVTYNAETVRPHSPTEGHTDTLTPMTPSNTPQSPTSGRESPQNEDLEATINRIRTLRLNADDRLHQRHFSQQQRRTNEE